MAQQGDLLADDDLPEVVSHVSRRKTRCVQSIDFDIRSTVINMRRCSSQTFGGRVVIFFFFISARTDVKMRRKMSVVFFLAFCSSSSFFLPRVSKELKNDSPTQRLFSLSVSLSAWLSSCLVSLSHLFISRQCDVLSEVSSARAHRPLPHF